MKPLKFICFFLAGAIIQTALYFLEGLSNFSFSLSTVIVVTAMVTVGGVILGFTARYIAIKKLKAPPFPLVMTYAAGTIAVIAAIRISIEINHPYISPDGSGLGNLPNLGREFALFTWLMTIPSAAINAIIQVIIGIRDKIIMKKEKNNGTL